MFSRISKIHKRILYGLLAFFSYLMLRITLEYYPIQDDVAFLRIKQQYIQIIHWKVAFFIHVFTSMFVLIAGFTQFSTLILKKYKPLHRWMGRLYVANVLLITGPASFVMSLYANGGITSRISFTILAVLWMYFTFMAFKMALKGQFKAHKAFIYRSYALTLSALTLRAWKWLIVLALHPPPMQVYRVVAWLGWVPNLILAEWLIRHRKQSKKEAQMQAQSIKISKENLPDESRRLPTF
jgi:hypothetical protein